MAKKKKVNQKTVSNNRTINILIIVATVLVIAIAALLAFTLNKGNENDKKQNYETTEINMADKISELNITENPVATLEMENGGIITIELYPKIAPNTVCNFIELANSGFYDGLIFHRCIPGFMIQGGCPEGTGMGGPGYNIKGEFTNNGFKNDLKHERGVISMARQSRPLDSAGSQFFIMVEDYPYLDGDYASFGKVITGMDVADAIVANATDANDKPLEDQVIKSIRVNTKGITYPEAQKIK